jgi:hypothetical protein
LNDKFLFVPKKEFNAGVGKIRRVMSNPHSKIDTNMSGY